MQRTQEELETDFYFWLVDIVKKYFGCEFSTRTGDAFVKWVVEHTKLQVPHAPR